MIPKKLKFLNFILPCLLITGIYSPPLRAEQSSVVTVLQTLQSIVSVESLNATVLTAKPQGFFDKATGRILIWKKMRPVGYTRNGSGFILDPHGIIATNAHTVRDAGNVFVTLHDQTRVPAKLMHIVPNTDIAFLYIEPPYPLTPLQFADSDAAAIGESVYTIGHSQWLKGTLIGGNISGLGKENFGGAAHVTLLQVNFQVYQGDSGSPILDKDGKLLGIISAGKTDGNRVTFAIASGLIAAGYQTYLSSVKEKTAPSSSPNPISA